MSVSVYVLISYTICIWYAWVVQLCKYLRSKRVCTSSIGRNPSPHLACAISKDPEVFQFKWYNLMVRVVRVNEQWMFREVWVVYIGHVQMARLQTSRYIRASSQGFRLFHVYVRTVRTQTRLQICHENGRVQQGGKYFSFHFLLFYRCAYIIVQFRFVLYW